MRLRLILSFALIVFISVTSVAVIARFGAAREVRSFMFPGGMTDLDSLVADLEDFYLAHHGWAGADALLGNLPHGPGWPGMGQGMMGQRLRLTDAHGKILADSAVSPPSGHLSPAELERAIPLKTGGKIVGYLFAQGGMGFTRDDERLLVARINRAAFLSGLVAGGFSLLLALLLAYRLLRPVSDLTLAARRLARGDLSQRVSVHGDDEIAALGQAFNHMADSLQRAEESRRAMTADIAHELRTPLSVQRANLEAMQDGIYPLTPDNLAPILEQNLLLNRLVEDLRTLALADAGQLVLERVPTDYPALVGRLVERFQPQATSRQVELRFTPPTSPPASALTLDPWRIEQILSNLLSNALRYTPDGGSIHLALACTSDSARLTIHDSGPGIPPEALPHVFQRFYRADRSRSRTEGGTGLGLAIARQLALAHGGSISAANHPDGGAVFTLTLPRGQPSQSPG